MEHTAECQAEQKELKRLHDEYVAKYPNYCHGCGGAGVLTWQENQAPLGSGQVWLETLSEPCDKCLLSGKCPRCGGEYTDEDCLKPCSICGWNFDSQCPPEKMEYPCECERRYDFSYETEF